MKRLILFRFHKEPEICRNRISILRKYNPGMPIHGLFGGEGDPRLDIPVYVSKKKDAEWKWKNGDLCVREWFGEVGKNLDFDMLHVVEWDLLILDSIEKVYSHIGKNKVGLTALVPLEMIKDVWSWLIEEPSRSEWRGLLSLARQEYGYCDEPYGCLGPGYCLPRSFLDRYTAEDIPELCHDELRLPLFAQIFGFGPLDTGFATMSPEDWHFFNCEKNEIGMDIIMEEGKNGRRVFHPFYGEFNSH